MSIRVRITAPLDGYTGEGPGGLAFVDGTAETSDPAIVGYCQGAGYRVEPVEAAPPDAPEDKPEGRPAAARKKE
ncbi:hypothetical protein [Streptomyces sp. BPTC-684]|uniref:hypothetical protein n=1 Tax=Streptomyces sp. BPTC-684 TaxID=3043734 RepID=UPI0024B082FC|nr:hypothetical protein [Streptomyces sp. BPTC-684]WHM36309.1 hypothetical protein QIY60_04765 [Streptomyces sp. BPTC-684]